MNDELKETLETLRTMLNIVHQNSFRGCGKDFDIVKCDGCMEGRGGLYNFCYANMKVKRLIKELK